MSKASIIYKLNAENKIQFTPKERRYIIKTLTLPTEQEVCEALSEYYQMEVIYTENSLCSIFTLKHKKHVGNSVCFYDKSDNIITFWSDLPPNLITLIGRFYEALTKGSERE